MAPGQRPARTNSSGQPAGHLTEPCWTSPLWLHLSRLRGGEASCPCRALLKLQIYEQNKRLLV